MQTRYTDAIPFAPRPSLEQYKTLAKDLVKASRSGDIATVRSWSIDWIERLARLDSSNPTPEYTASGSARALDWKRIEHTADSIVRDIRQSRLVPSEVGQAKPTLSEAQLVI